MDHVKLSIIIPCYNCSKTLEQAVASCYTQQPLIPFEVVLVDDGSTDETPQLIERLAKKYPSLRYVLHKQNLGGGATRNTAVKNSQGEIIFCLDSDDILPENTLPAMLATLIQKKCDGVVFEGGLSFSKDVTQAKKYSFSIDPSRPITLADFFEGKQVGVTSNFLYTKEAFETCGGYPTHHNFDTQGFGARFLVKNLKAYVCPGAFFYQRQFADHFSYFERAYNAGEFSLGFFFILQDTLHLLSPNIQDYITQFNVFEENRLNKKDLFSSVCQKYISDKNSFFATIPSQTKLSLANTFLIENKDSEALSTYLDFIHEAPIQTNLKNIYFTIAYIAIRANCEDKRISRASKVLKELFPSQISTDLHRPTILKRAWRKGLSFMRTLIK